MRWSLLGGPGSLQRGRCSKFDSVREDRPVVDVLLPTEIGFRSSNRFRQRRSFDGERGLASAMFVPGVVADGLDETYIE